VAVRSIIQPADDVSYGPAIDVSSRKIVGIGAPARMFVTTASNASELGYFGRCNEPFDDTPWSDVVLPVGYDSVGADTNAPVNAALRKTGNRLRTDLAGVAQGDLTDGNLTSFTHCAVPEPASWFMVDLGATYALDHLELFNRTTVVARSGLATSRSRILADDDGQPGPVLWVG